MKKTERVCVTLPVEAVKQLDEICFALNLKYSAALSYLISYYVKGEFSHEEK